MWRLALTCLFVGAVLLVALDTTVSLLLGVVLLLAAIVIGVFVIAEPGFLASDDPE